MAKYTAEDESSGPAEDENSGHAPDAPQRRRVAQRVAVHEREVGGPARPDHSGLWLAEQFAAAPGHRGQCLPRLEPGLDQALDLPRQLVRARRTTAEVRPRPRWRPPPHEPAARCPWPAPAGP